MAEPEAPGESKVRVLELAPPPAGIAGTSSQAGSNYHLTVSNGHGYLAHIRLESTWSSPPDVLFSIFTYPNNAALFRDIKRVGNRRVMSSRPGLKVVEVEQLGELKVLWITRGYSTWLHVTEDARDEERLSVTFELRKSDVLAKFAGSWELTPVRDAATGAVVGCRGVLEQDVLPAGMPLFLQKVPVLGGLLRGISVRAVTRLMEDINAAVAQVVQGLAGGSTVQRVLNGICGECEAEEAYTNGNVSSFAIGSLDEEDDDEAGSDEEGQAGDGNDTANVAVQIHVCDAVTVKLIITYL